MMVMIMMMDMISEHKLPQDETVESLCDWSV